MSLLITKPRDTETIIWGSREISENRLKTSFLKFIVKTESVSECGLRRGCTKMLEN